MEVLYRLSYRGTFCSWGREDSNLRRRSRQIYSLLPLAARAHPRARLGARAPKRPIMVANATHFSTDPGKGFEPPTCRLQGGCSTAELPGRNSTSARRLRRLVSTLPVPGSLSAFQLVGYRPTFAPRTLTEDYSNR